MAFGNKKKPEIILTKEQRIARYWAIAETSFVKSGKAGRLEALNLHATRSVAASQLAMGLATGAFESADDLDDDEETDLD